MKTYLRTINRKVVTEIIRLLNTGDHIALGRFLTDFRGEYVALWVAVALADKRCKVTVPGAVKILRKFSL
jgi:hypothetical protein